MKKNIVLTSDRTVMTEYNGNPLFGFTSCCYHRTVPKKAFFAKIVPPVPKNRDLTVKIAPIFIRKAEAVLLKAGFDVRTTDQYNIHNVIDK